MAELERVAAIHQSLGQLGATLATAESLTGGWLASMLTAVPGASHTFVGGFVTYATTLKVSLLGVSAEVISTHGVVSAECARAMAEGARIVTEATYAVSTTGVAGPGPQAGVPAGTVFVGLAGPQGATSLGLNLSGSRTEIRELTCEHALGALEALVGREVMGLQ
jgi:nicotinamide-nucleotide amidase